MERLLTVEVRNYPREIVQVRGKFNRMPLPEEEYMLNQWARPSGPHRSTMIRALAI